MIYFRADGNSILGSGHVMRCLSLADAFCRKDVTFIVADENMKALIEGRGYECLVLGTDFKDMEGELERLLSVIEETASIEKPCTESVSDEQLLFIVDSYYVTATYLQKLKNHINNLGGKLTYIDDLAAFPYPVDDLVNYNIYADEKEYLRLYKDSKLEDSDNTEGFAKNIIPKMLLGPSFALLRKEFENTDSIFIKDRAKKILVLTGGADSEHVALGLVNEIIACSENLLETESTLIKSESLKNCEGLEYHFVIGMMSPDYEKICELTKQVTNIILHRNVSDMKSLMLECDMAVSAAGSTQYELCSCGIPTINYVLADNQIPGAKGFAKENIMICAGDIRQDENLCKNIILQVNKLAEDAKMRATLSAKAKKLVDGLGAKRLARELTNE